MAIAANVMRGNKRAYPCRFCPKEHTSITTYLKVIGSDQLMGWAGKVGTKKLNIFAKHIKNFPEVSDDERDFIYQGASKASEAEWFKTEGDNKFWKSGYEISKESTEIGTIVHAAIEAFLLGKGTDSLQGEAQNAYQAFLEWFKTVTLETLGTETTFYNCAWDYACTTDWRGKLNGKLTLGDWKTSTDIFSSSIIQCWGNAIADEMQNGNVLYEQVMVGCFRKDGTSKILIIPRRGLENGFGGIEQARELIQATIPWFKYQESWNQKFPYISKKKS
jgi:hypothetical protein